MNQQVLILYPQQNKTQQHFVCISWDILFMTRGNVHALQMIHKMCAGCIPHNTMCVDYTQ